MTRTKHAIRLDWLLRTMFLSAVILIVFLITTYLQWDKPHQTAIAQEVPKVTRTCYFMRIQFVGANQNGAELEVTEIPAECPPTHKPRRD